jgi:hypothetical protein
LLWGRTGSSLAVSGDPRPLEEKVCGGNGEAHPSPLL